jgi:CheY-like chemotaxis protein
MTEATDNNQLDGLTVLAVEDESLVAMLLEDLLHDLGCNVVGPAPSREHALSLLEQHEIDAAVLDINIIGGNVFPVADRLRERGIPFIFSTGYGAAGLSDAHRDCAVVQKPYSFDSLRRALESVVAKRAADH